jgi:hypothetical protein
MFIIVKRLLKKKIIVKRLAIRMKSILNGEEGSGKVSSIQSPPS